MTVAVSAAVSEGAEAVVCASTGNTAASAAAYAARAGLRGAVIVPEGKIATGKLAQALMHGARVIALRGNFDEALALVRELADAPSDRARQLRQRLPHRGPEDRRVRGLRRARRAARRALHPGRQRRQRHGLVEGASRSTTRAPRMHGYQAEGAAPLVRGAPVENPETVASAIRIGNPARWENAMNAFTASRGEVRAVSDAEILDAYSLLGAREGVFCEPASAASVAGLLKYGAEGRVVCVLTGHGLKDPQTAMNRAAQRRALRARYRERGAGGARDEAPARSSACRPPRRTSVPATTCSRRRCRRRSSWRSRRAASSSVECDVPGVALDRTNLCVRAFELLHPADGLALRDPLGDPAGGGPRLERRGDRGRACRGRPPLRARRAAVRACAASSRAIPTTSPPRCSAASSSARAADPVRLEPPPELEAVLVVPADEVVDRGGARRDARRGAAGRCRRQRRPRRAARAGARAGRPLADRARPRRLAPPAAPRATSTRARWSSSRAPRAWARWARRSPAPGRRCCSGATGSRPAPWSSGSAGGGRRAHRAGGLRRRRGGRERAVSAEVEAAGGVVLDDEGRVALVHRPRYDDWSLPKGKLEPGEAFEEAALREVEEETGMRCRLGDELDPVRVPGQQGPPEARPLLADGGRRTRLRAERRGGRAALAAARGGRPSC